MTDSPVYGEPIQNNTQNELNVSQPQGIISNQQTPQTVVSVTTTFGTQPVSMNCTFCKQPITTKVNRSCSIGSVLLCICTCFIFWVCIQCCRNKEITCCNAEHTCPNCGKTLGYYENCWILYILRIYNNKPLSLIILNILMQKC